MVAPSGGGAGGRLVRWRPDIAIEITKAGQSNFSFAPERPPTAGAPPIAAPSAAPPAAGGRGTRPGPCLCEGARQSGAKVNLRLYEEFEVKARDMIADTVTEIEATGGTA